MMLARILLLGQGSLAPRENLGLLLGDQDGVLKMS